MQTAERLHVPELSYTSYSQEDAIHSRPKGTVIMIGGKAGSESLQAITENLPPATRLTISTIASDDEEKANYDFYHAYFREIGYNPYHLSRKKIDEEQDTGIDSDTSGYFLTGGRQDAITRLLDLNARKRLSVFLYNGGLIAGTSAGASAIGDIMPYMDTHAEGLGIIPSLIVDQHIQRPHRAYRINQLIDIYPDKIGMKISENTAVIYKDEMMQVMGEGVVYLLAGEQVPNRGEYFSDSDEIEMRHGDVFDISRLQPQKMAEFA